MKFSQFGNLLAC
jgi:WD40 repeat protein